MCKRKGKIKYLALASALVLGINCNRLQSDYSRLSPTIPSQKLAHKLPTMMS